LANAEQPTDADLIRNARAGSEPAFRDLVERWHPRIHRWAMGMVDDPDDADDVTQQVLVRLHLRLGRFRGDSAFGTWLYQITRNAARDTLRRRRRRERAYQRLHAADPVGEAPPSAADALEARETTALARDALARLPERQREVFDLVDLQGFAAHEVAALLGLDDGTVRAHLFRARRAVRAAILALAPTLTEGR
jgi:RNA polymerase sigma-70 factor (ECF subfamily)